jgi:transposase
MEADRAKSETNFVRAVVAEDGPVRSVAPSSPSATEPASRQRIEIELASGRRIIVDASVDVDALGRIVEALDRHRCRASVLLDPMIFDHGWVRAQR